MEGVDPEAETIREEGEAAALIEPRQIVPEGGIIAEGQIDLLGGVTLMDQFCHDALLRIESLSRHLHVTHRNFETAGCNHAA